MQSNNRLIVVKGIGKVSVPPDLIVLNMEIEAIDLDYDKTVELGTEMVNSLRAAIVSAGHDGKELKTTSFNVSTKYESYKVKDDYKKRFAGYVCSHSLKLEFAIDMEKLSATLGAIAKCNANPEFSIRFSIKDTNAVSEQLLQSAIENATVKATILAKSAGVKLGTIQRIEYSWHDIHLYSDADVEIGGANERRDALMFSPVSIEPEDINVTDTAAVVWSIE